MTPNRKTALPVQAGTLGNAVPKTQVNHTTKFTPKQRRIMSALNGSPGGIWSFDLGRLAGALNVSQQITLLRRMGVNIICEMKPFVNQDGEKSQVGLYRLAEQGEET